MFSAGNTQQSLREHIRSKKFRLFWENLLKMEAERSAIESNKEDQQVHIDPQGLLKINEELRHQVEQARKKLEMAHADIKRIPEMQSDRT